MPTALCVVVLGNGEHSDALYGIRMFDVNKEQMRGTEATEKRLLRAVTEQKVKAQGVNNAALLI
jgi:hypothetical protein